MRIVYLIPGCGVSGGVAVVCQHANRLLQRGHEVYLVTETLEKSIDWFPHQKVPVLPLDEYPENVEILIATGWSTSFTVVDLPAQQKFYFVQSDETRFHSQESIWKNITALSYRLNFNYLTEAHWLQKWLMENFGHEAELIPNGIDSDIFHPDQPMSPKGKRPRILLEGAIGLPYKGMSDAFSAVANLDAEIWCVSSFGEPDPSWRCDRFFRQIPMGKMRKLYSSCDVLLKLSRVEGFFGPPLEMMACGGTVVVGKVSGYDEYIVDGYNALVVEPGDVASAKVAVSHLLSDANLRNNLIANGLATAKAWQWERSIDRLEKYYQNLLTEKQGKPLSQVSDMADNGIAFSYKLLRGKTSIFDQNLFSDLSEPVDLIFLRIRKFEWVKRFAKFIYRIYKKLKQLKNKALWGINRK
jgi:glycosyltransferase involved in cell wall biosynthesis